MHTFMNVKYNLLQRIDKRSIRLRLKTAADLKEKFEKNIHFFAPNDCALLILLFAR